jgi:hypothetical protein
MIWVKPVENNLSSNLLNDNKQQDIQKKRNITESFKEFLDDLRMEQQEQM